MLNVLYNIVDKYSLFQIYAVIIGSFWITGLVHELMHALVAKLMGCKINEFCLGGILDFIDTGKVKIGLIPTKAYVDFEIPEELKKDDKYGYKISLVLMAGIFGNVVMFILGYIAYLLGSELAFLFLVVNAIKILGNAIPYKYGIHLNDGASTLKAIYNQIKGYPIGIE